MQLLAKEVHGRLYMKKIVQEQKGCDQFLVELYVQNQL